MIHKNDGPAERRSECSSIPWFGSFPALLELQVWLQIISLSNAFAGAFVP